MTDDRARASHIRCTDGTLAEIVWVLARLPVNLETGLPSANALTDSELRQLFAEYVIEQQRERREPEMVTQDDVRKTVEMLDGVVGVCGEIWDETTRETYVCI